jgi:pyruvate/2-oxoglutarate dehydrogenase complex dihydrolipoamide acyltransferase (E2) component
VISRGSTFALEGAPLSGKVKWTVVRTGTTVPVRAAHAQLPD